MKNVGLVTIHVQNNLKQFKGRKKEAVANRHWLRTRLLNLGKDEQYIKEYFNRFGIKYKSLPEPKIRRNTKHRTTAVLRNITAKDIKRHGNRCQGNPGCHKHARKVFESKRQSNYGRAVILLCLDCNDPKILFSNANKDYRRVG